MTAPRFRFRRSALPLAAAASMALALTAGAALAQPYGYGGPPDQQRDLARLHAALHVTAAQEGAWRAFVAANGPDPEAQARERSAQAMLPTLTAPQRVDLSIAAMQADLDTLRQRGAALKAFYATLTPDQQKVFDRETLQRGEEGYEE